MSLPLPPEVWDPLQRFLSDGKSGQVILEIREGTIVACKVSQSIRVSSAAPLNSDLEYKAQRR